MDQDDVWAVITVASVVVGGILAVAFIAYTQGMRA